MDSQQAPGIRQRIRTLIIGQPRDPLDRAVFHHVSLIAFFAWIGLGADGLSSSCYGPEEAFLALGPHKALGIFVALAAGLTIIILSASYSQIIELFPTGGGGYLVASKLLTPKAGLISGCALLIDYVLTITISIASGADALFSILPAEWLPYRFTFAMAGVAVLTTLNLRGVKESVIPLVPIFLTFLITHAIIIFYAVIHHAPEMPRVVDETMLELRSLHAEVGLFGVLALILRAYSMGAGTFTGIEAVSNGLPVLRDPKVQTGKRTMRYMAASLAFTVVGLMIGYLLFRVEHTPGKTLNAVLFQSVTHSWPPKLSYGFVLITLVSEAAILFVAAQSGFIPGPRVLANMATDRWFPTRFAMLSDRLVTQNGILLMGAAAAGMMLFTGGSVRFLVVLYSINVFVTFVLSQLGMVRHWLRPYNRARGWQKKLAINGAALMLTAFILVAVIIIKFNEGGWITILVTGGLIVLALFIRRHYERTFRLLGRLDDLVKTAERPGGKAPSAPDVSVPPCDPQAKTAVLLVNGFNGLGLHTLLNIFRLFGNTFANFVFVQVGVVDAGVFKGSDEIKRLEEKVRSDLDRYVAFMNRQGCYAEGVCAFGTDVAEEVVPLVEETLKRFPKSVLFGGQLVFPEETFLSRLLHNYTIFSLQQRFYHRGVPLVILPIRV